MSLLSLSDIDLIRADIRRQRVGYSHLLDDLVDHVCCDVEQKMNSGLSFQKAYAEVKSRIGSNRFKKIQEETLLLIDHKYRIMKTFMKIFGVIAPALISLGALFKIQHWPGGSILLALGFFFLCVFFLPSSAYVLYTENKLSKKHLLMYLSGLFSSVIFLFGILFKVQHWPGASILITVGLLMLGLLFLPSLVFLKVSEDRKEGNKPAYILGLFAGIFYIAVFLFKMMHWPGASIFIFLGLILIVAIFLPAFTYVNFKDETYVSGRFIFLVVTVMMAVIFISMLALNVTRNVFNEFIVAETQMNNVLQDLTRKNAQLSESLNTERTENSVVSEILKKTEVIETWIDQLKYDLIIAVEQDNSEAFTGSELHYIKISGKDAMAIPTEILFGSDNNGKVYQLKRVLMDYKKWLLSCSDDPELLSGINLLLDFTGEDISGDNYSWEQLNFEKRSLMSVLNSLTTIQLQIRLAEKEILTKLSGTVSESTPNITPAANTSS